MERIIPHGLFVGSFIPNWLLKRKEISFGAKLCYARLSQFSGRNGECFPSQETLALELGSSVSAIKRFLEELLQCQLIGKGRRGRTETNYYYFTRHPWLEEFLTLEPRQPKSGLSRQPESEPSREPESGLQRESVKENQLKENNSHSLQTMQKETRESWKNLSEKIPENKKPPDLNTFLKSNNIVSQRLAAFKALYPKRYGWGAGEREFLLINPSGALFEKMLESVKLHIKSEDWQKDNGRWIPKPETWLHDRHWENEVKGNIFEEFLKKRRQNEKGQ